MKLTALPLAAIAWAAENCPIDFALEYVQIQDISLSYDKDLPILKEKMPELLEFFMQDFPTSRFGLVTFMDKGWGGLDDERGFGYHGEYNIYDHCYKIDSPLSSEPQEFLAALDACVIGHGGQHPESQLDSVYRTALQIPEIGWLSDGGKLLDKDAEGRDIFRVITIATDASFHEGAEFPDGLLKDGTILAEASPYGDCSNENFPHIEKVREALQGLNANLLLLVTEDRIPWWEIRAPDFGVPYVISRLDEDSSNIVDAVKEGLLDLVCPTEPPDGSVPPPDPSQTGVPPEGSEPPEDGPPGTAPTTTEEPAGGMGAGAVAGVVTAAAAGAALVAAGAYQLASGSAAVAELPVAEAAGPMGFHMEGEREMAADVAADFFA